MAMAGGPGGEVLMFSQDLRARNDALSEAKLQAEIQKEVERGTKRSNARLSIVK